MIHINRNYGMLSEGDYDFESADLNGKLISKNGIRV